MAERRALIDGINGSRGLPGVDPVVEQAFIKAVPPNTGATASASRAALPQKHLKSPISTRIRADLAAALKRASLQRQLAGVEPHSLQDILEQLIEPWLRDNGYLP